MLAMRQRGDTIIEVLLAVTVFSMVAVGVITVMNQGTNTAQRALEITLVRQQIDAQAEALRAVHQAHAANRTPDDEWTKVINHSGSFNQPEICPGANQITNAFAMNPATATIIGSNWYAPMSDPNAPVYAQVDTSGAGKSYGIWIETNKVPPASGNAPDAYNFRIRACWFGAGMGSTPMQLETLVRLYEI